MCFAICGSKIIDFLTFLNRTLNKTMTLSRVRFKHLEKSTVFETHIKTHKEIIVLEPTNQNKCKTIKKIKTALYGAREQLLVIFGDFYHDF